MELKQYYLLPSQAAAICRLRPMVIPEESRDLIIAAYDLTQYPELKGFVGGNNLAVLDWRNRWHAMSQSPEGSLHIITHILKQEIDKGQDSPR